VAKAEPLGSACADRDGFTCGGFVFLVAAFSMAFGLSLRLFG
jgi:hypothetical protein